MGNSCFTLGPVVDYYFHMVLQEFCSVPHEIDGQLDHLTLIPLGFQNCLNCRWLQWRSPHVSPLASQSFCSVCLQVCTVFSLTLHLRQEECVHFPTSAATEKPYSSFRVQWLLHCFKKSSLIIQSAQFNTLDFWWEPPRGLWDDFISWLYSACCSRCPSLYN